MTSNVDIGRFRQAIKCLSPTVKRCVLPLSEQLGNSVQEIRLRINRPLALVCPRVTYYLTSSGGLVSTPINGSMLNVSRAEIVETFQNICNYSVYTRQNEIVNGFVTMQGGHRAGICGTAVVSKDKTVNIRDITSINIRIAREFCGCAKTLVKQIGNFDKGILICGAPCSGKTTILRDVARILSTEYSKNIALIDERGELAGTSSGLFQNDIGMCDVYDSYKKSEAMLHAIRSMAPDIIICDEIGSSDDVTAVEQAVNCGVALIATVHSANELELRKKENIKRIARLGAFSKIVFLSNRNNAGEVIKIMEAGDVFGA